MSRLGYHFTGSAENVVDIVKAAFQLSWNSGQGAVSYRIYTGPSSGNYTDGLTEVGNVLTKLITWLFTGRPHYIIVKSVDSQGFESLASNEVVVP